MKFDLVFDTFDSTSVYRAYKYIEKFCSEREKLTLNKSWWRYIDFYKWVRKQDCQGLVRLYKIKSANTFGDKNCVLMSSTKSPATV